MPEIRRVIEVTDFEHRLMVNCMRTARNEYIDEGAPTEDVSRLMVKVMEAPTKKEKRKADREAR
ncbi:MAG: hypothetical protein IJK65_02080 [Clostridiales bacterium]|nr:hypothetical protein [Clostridiales bacterium]